MRSKLCLIVSQILLSMFHLTYWRLNSRLIKFNFVNAIQHKIMFVLLISGSQQKVETSSVWRASLWPTRIVEAFSRRDDREVERQNAIGNGPPEGQVVCRIWIVNLATNRTHFGGQIETCQKNSAQKVILIQFIKSPFGVTNFFLLFKFYLAETKLRFIKTF